MPMPMSMLGLVPCSLHLASLCLWLLLRLLFPSQVCLWDAMDEGAKKAALVEFNR